MLPEMRQIVPNVKYLTLTHCAEQWVQIHSFETLADDVLKNIGPCIETPLNYVGRCWADEANDTPYVFSTIGNFDMKFRLPADYTLSDYESGFPLLRKMFGPMLFMTDDLVTQLAQQATEDKLYLIMLFYVDDDHEKFRQFRERIRRYDPEMLKVGKLGLFADYFPVSCKVVEAAITNAPSIWHWRYSNMWMYTYLY
jgi:hypothetical protein